MANFSLTELAGAYDYSVTQTWRHIEALKKEKKFKKTSRGRWYNEKDAKRIAELLGFTLPQKKNGKA